MKIAVMGHMGMLGLAVQQEVMKRDHVLRIFYQDSWEIKALRIEDGMLPDSDIDVVINCAGAIPQKEHNPKNMVRTNGYGPHHLAAATNDIGARLIHVGTDCVFSAPGPHTEASPVTPQSLYGLSKATGEVTYGPNLTLRTSFIGLGPYGLLHDLMNSEHVEASQHLLWSGHTALTVARCLVDLAERPDITGLMHLPGEFINRYNLCLKLKEYFKLPVTVIEKNNFFADRRLISTRWAKLGLKPAPMLDEELKEYIL